MNKKFEYQIVTFGELSIERTVATITERVNRLLNQGWEPSGGVSLLSVRTINGKPFYEASQAVLKRLD